MFSRETLLRLRGTRAGLAHDDFLGKAQIGLGAFGLDVVMKDGLAEAGGLGKPHGAGDDRFKDLIGEATVHFVLHLPRQAVAPVEHGQHHAEKPQLRIEPLLDLFIGLQQLDDAFQGKELDMLVSLFNV